MHGWRDDIILYEHSVRYARDNGAALHLVDANHFFYAPHEIALLCRHFSGFPRPVPVPGSGIRRTDDNRDPPGVEIRRKRRHTVSFSHGVHHHRGSAMRDGFGQEDQRQYGRFKQD